MKKKLEQYSKIRFLLTGKCTAKCSYCHNEGQTKEASLLSLEYIKEIIGNLEYKNILPNEVVLSGGEPTLNKEIGDIAKFLKSKNIYVSMASHAGHTNLLRPVLPYLDELKVHLDSFNHDEQLKSMGISIKNIIASINLAKKYPVKLIVNHPLINKIKTIEFIESARKISIDCKIIEEFGNKDNINLRDVDWEEIGYSKSLDNSFIHINSGHRLFFKRCNEFHNNDKTLFIGSEGIRTSIEASSSINGKNIIDTLLTVV
jgi:MoaA/NifB/PqqE/SkfB family radical SAM enzyme